MFKYLLLITILLNSVFGTNAMSVDDKCMHFEGKDVPIIIGNKHISIITEGGVYFSGNGKICGWANRQFSRGDYYKTTVRKNPDGSFIETQQFYPPMPIQECYANSIRFSGNEKHREQGNYEEPTPFIVTILKQKIAEFEQKQKNEK